MRSDILPPGADQGNRSGPNPLDRVLRVPILTLVAAVLALGSAAIGTRFLVSIDDIVEARGEAVTGDFISFYTAASILRDGKGDRLYDLPAQLEVQRGLTGKEEGQRWSGYINPPLLALALSPLANLPYPQAFRWFSLLMILSFAGTLLVLGGALPGLRRRPAVWWTAWLLVFSFHPVFRTMVGGQNTVLTLFLLAGLYAAWRRERWALAGLCLGLLSYKPQFVPLFALILLVERRWLALGTAGLVGAGHYALGAWCCGWQWPAQLVDALRAYRPLEASIFHLHISLAPAFRFSLPGPLDTWLTYVGIGAVIVGVGWGYGRYATDRRWEAATGSGSPGPRFGLLFGFLVAATMLASPHLLYYDVGLVSLPVLLALDDALVVGDTVPLRVRVTLAAGYLLYPLYGLGDTLRFQPLLLWPIACFVWLGWALSRPRAGPTTR